MIGYFNHLEDALTRSRTWSSSLPGSTHLLARDVTEQGAKQWILFHGELPSTFESLRGWSCGLCQTSSMPSLYTVVTSDIVYGFADIDVEGKIDETQLVLMRESVLGALRLLESSGLFPHLCCTRGQRSNNLHLHWDSCFQIDNLRTIFWPAVIAWLRASTASDDDSRHALETARLIADCVDMAVYHIHRCFRLPGSTKLGKCNELVPIFGPQNATLCKLAFIDATLDFSQPTKTAAATPAPVLSEHDSPWPPNPIANDPNWVQLQFCPIAKRCHRHAKCYERRFPARERDRAVVKIVTRCFHPECVEKCGPHGARTRTVRPNAGNSASPM